MTIGNSSALYVNQWLGESVRTEIKQIAAAVGVVTIILLASTGLAARAKESAMRKVKPGMHKAEVEALLGPGLPDISSDGREHNWPPGRMQYCYKGNPSIWYLRWEDELIVGYTNDTVADTLRCGL
jgi:hypothetical protein